MQHILDIPFHNHVYMLLDCLKLNLQNCVLWQAIPKWWIWLYWICPSSWWLNSYMTSQYGDIKQQITTFGQSQAINSFLEDYYGYRHDRLGLVALVIATFPLIAVFLFAYFTQKLNFQRR